ncbi:MAG: hypothetical protein ACI8TS_001722, partial [Flavobacteriales bacterium]
QMIDTGVSELEINHMTIQSTVSENLPYVFYYDDLSSYVTNCIPLNIEDNLAIKKAFNVLPFTGGVEIQALLNGEVSIFDLNGKLLSTLVLNQGQTERVLLSSGVYIINWKGDTRIENQKISVP